MSSRNLLLFGSSLLASLTNAVPQSAKWAIPNDLLSPRGSVSNGPVLDVNFPDPSIIKVGTTWYSFATRSINSAIHIQAATSQDFVHWTLVENPDGSQYDALPTLAPWVNQTLAGYNTWAPDVSQLDDGRFIMYYCATTNVDASKHCVSAAYSDTPLGPYSPIKDTLYCPLEQGGAIDPSGFYEPAVEYPTPYASNEGSQVTKRYVVYKVDGGSIGHGGPCGNTVPPIVGTPLMLQEVNPSDGITPIGDAYELLNNDGAADQGVTEAPNLIKAADGTYILFFSSGCFVTDAYTVSYATAKNITGPYTRHSQPLLQTGDFGLYAPGGMSVRIDDDTHAVFHSDRSSTYVTNSRLLHTALLSIAPGGIVSV